MAPGGGVECRNHQQKGRPDQAVAFQEIRLHDVVQKGENEQREQHRPESIVVPILFKDFLYGHGVATKTIKL